MRLRSVSLRGLTRFTGEQPITIDFDALGPGLVAFVGENGSGKTTVTEAVPGGLFRALPSRPGSLYDACHGRDAFIELGFDDAGVEISVRLLIDAERRSCEGYVALGGEPITDGKADAFNTAIAERFGSRELFLASVFAAQTKGGSLLTMKKGERKALFVELLGLGHLEELAGEARRRRSDSDTGLVTMRAELATLERDADALAEARETLDASAAAAATAQSRLEVAKEKAAEAQSALERAREAAGQLQSLRAAEAGAREARSSIERLLTEKQGRPEQLAQRAKEAIAQIDARGVEQLGDKAHERHTQAIESLKERRARAEAELAREPEIKRAEQELEELRRERATLAEQDQEQARLEGCYAEAIRGAQGAVGIMERARLRWGDRRDLLKDRAKRLGQVPCTTDAKALASSCPLLADAREAQRELDAMGAEPPENAEHEAAAAKFRSEATRALEAKDALAERADERAARQRRIAEEESRLSQIAAAKPLLGRARQDLEGIEAEKERADRQLSRELELAKEACDAAADERQRIEAGLAESLETAQRQITEAQASAEDAQQKHEQAQKALRGAEDLVMAAGGLGAAKEAARVAASARETAEQSLRESEGRRAAAESRVQDLEARTKGLPALRERLGDVEQDLSEWSLLERGLGKDGVQALEVDAAGPEVAQLTNELLDSCYGPRFSIEFQTLREKKSRKGEFSEVFEVNVFDGGNQRPVEALSGGEKVIVGEAINLALAIFNARKSGIRWETLFRDETASALDPENASRYVAMLRRAMELGGFSQVVFVAHLPEVWERADAKVHFADGRVQVAA